MRSCFGRIPRGAILAAASESASNGQLWVTYIAVIAPTEKHSPVSEEECLNA